MTTEVIQYDDDRAAKKITLEGWVSRHGHFYHNDKLNQAEHLARWDGCTHLKCECGNLYSTNGYVCCDACRAVQRQKNYLSMPFQEWDGVAPLVEYDNDRYFFSEEDLREYCEENDVNVEGMQLVICEPTYLRELDGDDHFDDDLPEDATLEDVAPEIHAAFESLNAVIREHNARTPSAWYPGRFRTTIKAEELS